VDRRTRSNLTALELMFQDLHCRLSGVVIEGPPWTDFIARNDGPGTPFYLDPPNRGRENHYGKAIFDPTDFASTPAQLAGIKSRFIMSINDVPAIRETFANFNAGSRNEQRNRTQRHPATPSRLADRKP
jgi:DNA adenine methylase